MYDLPRSYEGEEGTDDVCESGCNGVRSMRDGVGEYVEEEKEDAQGEM